MGRPESSSNSSDLIRIVDLAVYAYIGVPDEERSEVQRLLVSLDMLGESFAHAASTDNVSWTINYADVAEHVRELSGRRPRKLLETLAEEMALDLIKRFPIKWLTLEIKKFVLPDAGYVSVNIERAKQAVTPLSPTRSTSSLSMGRQPT
jgi:dihydroneopterin aldolase